MTNGHVEICLSICCDQETPCKLNIHQQITID